jgi:hypothetical protein
MYPSLLLNNKTFLMTLSLYTPTCPFKSYAQNLPTVQLNSITSQKGKIPSQVIPRNKVWKKFYEHNANTTQVHYFSLIPASDFLFYIKYFPFIRQINTGFHALFSIVDSSMGQIGSKSTKKQ